MSQLPNGFIAIKPDTKPQVSFDVGHNRFYLSRTLSKDYGVPLKSRVSLAYNLDTRQLLIDKNGRSFYVDSRGYITSARFTEQLQETIGKNVKSTKYAVNRSQSNARFIVLDETYYD